jgi:hypothetical protein
MNRLLFVSSLVAASACGPAVPAVITRTEALDTRCMANSAVAQTSGTLDMAGAGTYLLDLHLESTMNADPTHAHDFVQESLKLSYDMQTPPLKFQDETILLFATMTAGQPEDLATGILGPVAIQKLRDNFLDPSLSATLIVHMSLTGHLVGSGHVETDPVDYPITVTNSGAPSCAVGFVSSGPCGQGGGQDGAPVECQ